jgi:hypothetical protein
MAGQIKGTAFAVLIDKAMLALDESERLNGRFEFGVTRDVRKAENSCARGRIFENWLKILSGRGAKINALLRHSFAFLLRGIVSSPQKTLVRGGMSVGQRVAMIGGKKIVRNALLGEVVKREEMPGPLAKTGFEMLGAAVAPDRDRIKGGVEEIRGKQPSKNVKDKEKIILVGVRTVTDIVAVLREATAVLHELEYDNKILCVDTGLVAVPGRGVKGKTSKIDEDEELTRLKVGALLLVLVTLPTTIVEMLLAMLVLNGEVVRGSGIVKAAHLLRQLAEAKAVVARELPEVTTRITHAHPTLQPQEAAQRHTMHT